MEAVGEVGMRCTSVERRNGRKKAVVNLGAKVVDWSLRPFWLVSQGPPSAPNHDASLTSVSDPQSSDTRRTFFLRIHQKRARLAITRTATTGPAIAPGLMPPPPEDDWFLIHWIVGH